MVYGNAHRFLLRSIASQGVISFEDGMKIFKSLPDFKKESIDKVINDINNVIKPFQQNIKIVIDELTSERKIVFLSLGYDDATKSQNMFSAKELDYFRILIEEIMTTKNREIEITTALNLCHKVNPSLKKTDAEVILKMWCTLHYLDKNEKYYALGIRAIHEFEIYLQENMPDTIQKCSVCHKNVFRGVNCPACDGSIHTRCLNIYVEKVRKWPCCKADFSNTQFENLDNTILSQTQLLQTQPVRASTSDETMEVSQMIQDSTQVIKNSAKRRKIKHF